MAVLVWTDVQTYLNELDMQSVSNAASLAVDVEMQDESVFGVTTRKNRAGMTAFSFTLGGFFDDASGLQDKEIFDAIGGTSLVTVGPEGADDGETAYILQLAASQYSLGGEIGSLLGFTFEGQGRAKPTQGTVMYPAIQAAASDTGVKRQLGATAAGEQKVISVHCIQFDGTTLDIDVRSDVDNIAAGETVRGSFAQLAAVGSERLVVTTVTTDTWWDIDLTFVGTTFTALVTIGHETTL